MNIQALLGARPATGSSRRVPDGEKGRSERDKVRSSTSEPHDTVELSVEGLERAAADSGGK